ncbi:MAG: hypothetical protein E7166_05225 [Firmicutes bacterium]|nr:hypothetical protein [Bacillota bacterium]
MLNLSYIDYDKLISDMYTEINITQLDNTLQKRKKIFDFFINNISYDYKKLYELRFKNIRCDRRLEIQDVLIRKKGICNSLSVIYKLLLEKANIYSMCVCIKGHMINLVQNDNGTFSFDDVTKGIMKKDFNNDNIEIKSLKFLDMIRPIGDVYDYFNYSYSTALKLGQGIEFFSNKYTKETIYWLPVSTIDYAYKLIKKKNYDYLNLKNDKIKDYRYIVSLPDISLIQKG